MTKPNDYITDLHSRMKAIAEREQALIEALNEELSRADRKLLDDVRSVTFEHEARRAVILAELQGLAARLGAFPHRDEPYTMIEEETLDLPYYAPDEPLPEPEHQPELDAPPPRAATSYGIAAGEPVSAGGDWRKAAEKIRDGFEFQLYRRAS
jgi:hypothetical protein